jgi:hypothetical protein
VLELVRNNYSEIYPIFSSLFADKKALRAYWEQEAASIREYMGDRDYKLYFFHEEIKKS